MKDFNFHKDMQEKSGCPKCQYNVSSIHHSGADISPNKWLTGGRVTVVEILDMPDVDTRPGKTVDRCNTCGTLWETTYHWADRPPLILSSNVVTGDADYFEAIAEELTNANKKSV